MYKKEGELLNWNEISKQRDLSKDFIEEHKHQIKWEFLSSVYPIDEAFALQYKDYIHWGEICVNPCCTETFIERFQEEIDWNLVSLYSDISLSFAENHLSKVILGLLQDNVHVNMNKEDFVRLNMLKIKLKKEKQNS